MSADDIIHIPILLSGESHAASVGVRTTSAPIARKAASFSSDIFSGSVITTEYPLSVVFSIPLLWREGFTYLDGTGHGKADS